MLFWDKRILEVIETVSGVFFVSCLFKNVEDGFQWCLWPSGGRFKGKLVGGTRVGERLMVRTVVY